MASFGKGVARVGRRLAVSSTFKKQSHNLLSKANLSTAPRAVSSSLLFRPVARPSGSLQGTQVRFASNVVPFKLADIGEGIMEVEVLQWFIKEGDVVRQFDRLCEVQSDKATVEITSRYDGTVKKVHYAKGDMAKVGQPLVDIEVAGSAPSTSQPTATAEASSTPVAATSTPAAAASAAHPAGVHHHESHDRVLTTPAVRRIAREHGIDLSAVPATGKGGRLMKEDLLGFIANGGKSAPTPTPAASASAPKISAPTAAEDRVEPIRGLKRTMVKTMMAANQIPHFCYSDEVIVDALIQLRASLKPLADKQGIKLTYMPFLIKAASLALRDYPVLNAQMNEDASEILYKGSHNIGVAMDTPNGLIVPNIKGVQNKSVLEIAAEMNRLQKLGSEGKLSTSDLTGGTFSLSNIGSIGGTYMKPVIMTPEVAIGALGKFQKLPRFDEAGQVVPTTVMVATWAGDHRIIDGATMANFSNKWKAYIENPMNMLLDMK